MLQLSDVIFKLSSLLSQVAGGPYTMRTRILWTALLASRIGPLSALSAGPGVSSSFDPPSAQNSANARSVSDRRPLQSSHHVLGDGNVNAKQQPAGNVLILDHLNINHEKGRHDWLKAFYFDLLRCAVDPRKQDNLAVGRKTVWANAGTFQFHLPEGKPDAQVLEGVATLVYPDLQPLLDRARRTDISSKLRGSRFDLKMGKDGDELIVSDPWGTKFRVVRGDEAEQDTRGRQPGDPSESLGMRDLTIYAPSKCNVPGISRFYETVLGAPVLAVDADRCVVSVGPQQTLTFQTHPELKSEVRHEDLRDEGSDSPSGYPIFLSNYGPHVSMYVADLKSTYERADAVGVVYVNPRFKRRAYTLEEAIDDCMFRCLDIVDPLEPNEVILRLEHEIRSVVNRDGSKYRSCPFDAIPSACLK